MALRPCHLFLRPPHICPSPHQLRLHRPASNFRNRRLAPRPAPSSFRDRWRTRFGTRIGIIGIGVGVVSVGFIAVNLEVVPVSGRMRFNWVPASLVLQSGAQFYEELIKEYAGQILPKSHPYSRMVDRVMKRLVAGLDDQDWEVVVVDDETVNAFAIPGGKVFVFSGLIAICENDDGLAAILGHEIAHNLSHHTGEKLSSALFLGALAYLLSFYFDLSHRLVNQLFNIGFQMPGSRTQEAEADYIGLLLMAKACYNPADAVRVQERMLQAEKDFGSRDPQFLSTHPLVSRDRARGSLLELQATWDPYF
ncbi:hypothetical protein MMC07_004239 [Pseudocyphellaria aurata]|nr:hypothetical protein [Pseudocyphellaria aurata]